MRGLHPHELVALRADANGAVDLSHAKPLAGSSYSIVWPMGLLTSMRAVARPPATLYQWRDKAQTFALTVSSGGKTLTTTRVSRRFVRNRPERVQTTVAKDGFLGTFYALRGAAHRPAVLVFGGSEGGLPSRWEGDQLAAHGIPTLEVAYFHAPTVPDKLVNIPLEYFRTALEYARAIAKRRRGETTILRDYPNAGHYSNGAFFEYEPGVLTRDLFSPGTELAREDLTARVLRFLQRS